MKKSIFATVLFVALSTVTFSQSNKALKKIESKATQLVEKMNGEIIAGDKSLALSDEQVASIKKIQIDRIIGLRKLGKDGSEEDKKKWNRTHYQKIFKEVLSKEQLKARKKGKQKKGEQKI